ncbi:MAG: radical SAM protein [Phycisphaerae bacterium]|nr:radical SAM protein [Phycisphaerae bacterium]
MKTITRIDPEAAFAPAPALRVPARIEHWLDRRRNAGMADTDRLANMLTCCTMCPRACRVDRNAGHTGYCGIGAKARIASAGPHFGEESVLVGSGGSGTIFFSGCNLHCIYCQNYDISQQRRGRDIGTEELAGVMLRLAADGVSNINLVTPSHVVMQIAEAVVTARDQGLMLPVVYNTGGYDSVEMLKTLDGLIDIYMPDMKYADPAVSADLSDAGDYPQVNQAAIREMHRQVGDLNLENGLATRGLLVRHMVLPNGLSQSAAVVDFLAEEISQNTAINVMGQYRPCYQAVRCPPIMRRLYPEEINEAVAYAKERGLRVLES